MFSDRSGNVYPGLSARAKTALVERLRGMSVEERRGFVMDLLKNHTAYYADCIILTVEGERIEVTEKFFESGLEIAALNLPSLLGGPRHRGNMDDEFRKKDGGGPSKPAGS